MKPKNEKRLNYKQCKLSWFTKRKYVFAILIFFCSAASYSQEKKNMSIQENRITEKKSFLSNLKKSERNIKSDSTDSKHIEILLSKVHSSVYFNSGNVKSYGEKPICIFTDVQSLPILKDNDIKKDFIEMATVRIENQADLYNTIDLDLFSTFKSLKYIQIISTIPTNEQNITRMIINNELKYKVFFKTQNGDTE